MRKIIRITAVAVLIAAVALPTMPNCLLAGEITKEELTKMNAKYYDNKNNGRPGQADNVYYKIRDQKVILSAPYAVKAGEKPQATQSGTLVENASSKAGCSFISKAYNDGEDPHVDISSKYRNVLFDLVQKNKIRFLIDIVQMFSGDNPKKADIVIFTNNFETVGNREELEKIVQSAAEKYNLSYDWSSKRLPATNVVMDMLARAKLPGMQIRISSEYRTNTDMAKYNAMVNFLADLAQKIAPMDMTPAADNTGDSSDSKEGEDSKAAAGQEITSKQLSAVNSKYGADDSNGRPGQPNNVYTEVRDLRVILSAPYAVKAGTKSNAIQTGSLVEFASSRAGCSFIAKAYNDGEDANSGSGSVYRDTLLKLVKENQIRFLIDIAQILKGDTSKNADVVVFTNGGKTLMQNKEKIMETVNAAAEKHRLSIEWSPRTLASTYVLSDMYSRGKMPGMHMRISSNYRTSKDMEKYNTMVNFLADVVAGIAPLYTEKAMKEAGQISLTLDSDEVSYEVTTRLTTAPVVRDGIPMVPLRVVIEALGGEVEWIGERRTARIRLEGKEVDLVLDQAGPGWAALATTIDGHLMVPLGYVTEALGANAVWNPETGTLEIIK